MSRMPWNSAVTFFVSAWSGATPYLTNPAVYGAPLSQFSTRNARPRSKSGRFAVQNNRRTVVEELPYRTNPEVYRGTSLIRKRLPLGPYSRPMPRVLRGFTGGGGVFLCARCPCMGSCRCRANLAHIRQSVPEAGPGLQAKQLEPLKVFPFRSVAVWC